MKKIFFIVLVVSIVFNIYCTSVFLSEKKHQKDLVNLFEVENVTPINGLKDLEIRLDKISGNLYNTNKYFFIQTWDSVTCNSASNIDYMQELDSIVSTFDKDRFCFIFASEMEDESIEKFLNNHKINFKNFIFISEANGLISSVFTQKKLKYKTHPIQLVMDKKGGILYYNSNRFMSPSNDSILMRVLNSL